MYAGFSGGKLVAVALSNGAQRWEATVALPKGANELERIADVVGAPALQGREVCAAAYQGRVACFEADSGKAIWARDLSSITGVSVDARYAFVADERGTVHAFDRSNGATVWKQEKLAHRQLSLPLASGATVAVGDFEGEIHFLSRESGDFVARFSARGGPVRAAPVALSPTGSWCRRSRRRACTPFRREAGHRPRRAAQRRQVDALQPPDAQPRRHRRTTCRASRATATTVTAASAGGPTW